jgi:hypothetical protein
VIISNNLEVLLLWGNHSSNWLNQPTDIESQVDVTLLVNGLKYPSLKIMLVQHCLKWLKFLLIFVKLIFIAVFTNLIHVRYLPFWHRLPVGDALQAWRTTSNAQRIEFHLLMKYPCKGILQTKRTLVLNEAMVPLERTHRQTRTPTGHLDVVL